MSFDGDVASNSKTVTEQPSGLFDDGDEINLNTETTPSRPRHDSEQFDEADVPRIAHSIEDMHVAADDDRFASISPDPSSAQINISIVEFEKRGEGVGAYLVYKVVTKLQAQGISGYTPKEYEVWRRFSDFLGLHEKLIEKYLPRGIIVPIPPEKSITALTITKNSITLRVIQTNSNPANSREVGIRRSRLLERFLRRIVQHQRMRGDCDVRDFLTMETDLPKANQTSALSGAGMKRMMKSFGEVFSKMAFHMEEGDRWFEQAQSQVDELDESLRKLLQHAETLLAHRKDLSCNEERLSKAMSMLASCEESTSLARALSYFTDTLEYASVVWGRQAENDNAKFCESVGEYVSLISALKDVFEERVRSWQLWQNSQQMLSKKREQKSRLELSGRNDRAEQMRVEIEEMILKMDKLEQDFGDLSKLIREEIARFEGERKQDFKNMCIEYLQSVAVTQAEMLKLWKKFEPEVQKI